MTDIPDEPLPPHLHRPHRDPADVLASVVYFVCGLPFVAIGVVATIHSVRDFLASDWDDLYGPIAAAVMFGGIGALLMYNAYRAWTQAEKFLRDSPAIRRRVCAQCGYDLRGAATLRCPECGGPVPEPVDDYAVQLARMADDSPLN